MLTDASNSRSVARATDLLTREIAMALAIPPKRVRAEMREGGEGVSRSGGGNSASDSFVVIDITFVPAYDEALEQLADRYYRFFFPCRLVVAH